MLPGWSRVKRDNPVSMIDSRAKGQQPNHIASGPSLWSQAARWFAAVLLVILSLAARPRCTVLRPRQSGYFFPGPWGCHQWRRADPGHGRHRHFSEVRASLQTGTQRQRCLYLLCRRHGAGGEWPAGRLVSRGAAAGRLHDPPARGEGGRQLCRVFCPERECQPGPGWPHADRDAH